MEDNERNDLIVQVFVGLLGALSAAKKDYDTDIVWKTAKRYVDELDN